MNRSVILPAILVIVVVVGGFFLFRPTTAPNLVSNQTASTTSPVTEPQTTTGGTQPTVTVGTPTVKTISIMTSFDSSSFVSTSTYPTITGTANIPEVGIIINNSKDVGVVGTSEIPVVNGHWSYSCSVALAPGNYSLVLFVGNHVTSTGKLTVR